MAYLIQKDHSFLKKKNNYYLWLKIKFLIKLYGRNYNSFIHFDVYLMYNF